jgi:hypothetical protein
MSSTWLILSRFTTKMHLLFKFRFSSVSLQCLKCSDISFLSSSSSSSSVRLMGDERTIRKKLRCQHTKGTRSKEHTCCFSTQKPSVMRIGFSIKCKMGRAMDIKFTSKWLLLILECSLLDETQVALLTKTQVFIHRNVKEKSIYSQPNRHDVFIVIKTVATSFIFFMLIFV